MAKWTKIDNAGGVRYCQRCGAEMEMYQQESDTFNRETGKRDAPRYMLRCPKWRPWRLSHDEYLVRRSAVGAIAPVPDNDF